MDANEDRRRAYYERKAGMKGKRKKCWKIRNPKEGEGVNKRQIDAREGRKSPWKRKKVKVA